MDDSTPAVPPARQSHTIIADSRPRAWMLVMLLAGFAGSAAAVYYWQIGLTLSHYDAKGHLVVARRILDGLNPGWVQVGAVWLPLPHLIHMVPTQVDLFYRTGWAAVALNVVCYAVTGGLLFRLTADCTRSVLAASCAAAVFVLNPDVVYLQATSMTEPLLMVLTVGAVWACVAALGHPGPRQVRLAGWLLAAACLTRYEAWPVTAAVLGLGAVALWRDGESPAGAVRRVAALAVYPAVAALAFLVLGRASTGAWFTTSGFFVPENIATGRPLKAVLSVWWGAHQLTSYALATVALSGLVLGAIQAWRRPGTRLFLLPLAVVAAGALPAYAFYSGHPFRIRYMIPLIPAMAIGVGWFVGHLPGPWGRVFGGVAVATILGLGPLPLDARSPMVLEAQWDRPNREARMAVTAYLSRHWDGELVLASMGSLAHYMQELSGAGFAIRDFVHEGNGEIWDAASAAPAQHVDWMLIEERAEGGDVLAQRAASNPQFLAGFTRVAEGGGVVLYRRIRAAR